MNRLLPGSAGNFLPQALRFLRQPLNLGAVVLTLSGFLLLGPAHNSMSSVTTGVLLLHIGLGLLLLPPIAWKLLQLLRSKTRHPLSFFTLCATLCALSGLYLFLHAALGYSTAQDTVAWWLHIASGVGCWVLGVRTKLPTSSLKNGQTQGYSPTSDTRHPTPALPVLLMLLSLGALGATTLSTEYPAEDYYRDLTATNARQADNPLFPAGIRLSSPSAVATQSARWQSTPAAYCGQQECHTTAYQEWLSSSHRYAGSDPFYQRVASEYAISSGTEAVRWCAGCHAPETGVGYRGSGIGSTLPPIPPEGQTHRSAPTPDTRHPTPDTHLSTSGVDCLSCHATTGTPARTGNGRFELEIPENYPFGEAKTGWKQGLHKFLLRVRPGPHQRAYFKPALHRSAEFCAACHRQSFNVPQNHYQFVRGADEYGEWQSGPFSGRTTRPPGLATPAPKTCQECHFPSHLGHASHATLGGNTALPALRGDTAHLTQTENFLKQDRLVVDIFALWKVKPGQSRSEAGLLPIEAPLTPAPLSPGEEVLLDIVVSNRNVGHSFPAGYTDIKDAWVEVTLTDAKGQVLRSSGLPDAQTGQLPPDTHTYRTVPLDRKANPLLQHNLTDMVTTAMRRVIAPGSSDLARYRFTLPVAPSHSKGWIAPLRLTARLRYRSLRPDFARWALNGTAPPLPITTLAQATTTLGEKGTQPPNTSTVQRFLDYGTALLAVNSPEALRAFQMAQQLAPKQPEPSIGLGRAYLMEPALLEARAQFERALKMAPDNVVARAWLGVVSRKQGDYDRALTLFKPLTEQFPQDNALQFEQGQALIQLKSYAAAAEAAKRALAADPDDAAAHFQLENCYQRLQSVPDARREKAIRHYLAEDKLKAELVQRYLKQAPQRLHEAQPLPEHSLSLRRSVQG